MCLFLARTPDCCHGDRQVALTRPGRGGRAYLCCRATRSRHPTPLFDFPLGRAPRLPPPRSLLFTLRSAWALAPRTKQRLAPHSLFTFQGCRRVALLFSRPALIVSFVARRAAATLPRFSLLLCQHCLTHPSLPQVSITATGGKQE